MNQKIKSILRGAWYFTVSAFFVCVAPVIIGALIASIVALFLYGWNLIW